MSTAFQHQNEMEMRELSDDFSRKLRVVIHEFARTEGEVYGISTEEYAVRIAAFYAALQHFHFEESMPKYGVKRGDSINAMDPFYLREITGVELSDERCLSLYAYGAYVNYFTKAYMAYMSPRQLAMFSRLHDESIRKEPWTSDMYAALMPDADELPRAVLTKVFEGFIFELAKRAYEIGSFKADGKLMEEALLSMKRMDERAEEFEKSKAKVVRSRA